MMFINSGQKSAQHLRPISTGCTSLSVYFFLVLQLAFVSATILPMRYDNYTLKFSQQEFPFSNEVQLWFSTNLDDRNLSTFYAYDNYTLYEYQYNVTSKIWLEKWHWSLTETEDVALLRGILYFPKILQNGTFAFKTEKGIHLYQYRHRELVLMSKSENFIENEFHDVFDWHKAGNVIKFGHFYRQTDSIGVLTKHEKYGINFYEITNDNLLAGTYPLTSVNLDKNIVGDTSAANVFLADLISEGQQNIIIRRKDELNIYEFDRKKQLKHLMLVPISSKFDANEEKLFFARLTGQLYQDIVLVNSSGLSVYQYKEEAKNYVLIDHNASLFANFEGWNVNNLKTIQFEDINSDGKQDMLFSGPEGIKLFTFNEDQKQWISLLDTAQITAPELYGNIVKVTTTTSSAVTHPVIFIHQKNRLHWASVIKVESSLEEISTKRPAVTSAHTSSQFCPGKTTVFVRDRLDLSSIQNAVNTTVKEASFKLPLIDVPNQWGYVEMSFVQEDYNQTSGMLGIGWSLSLPYSYILMDSQSSVLVEDDKKYYLILQDAPHELQFLSENSTDTIYFFKLSNANFNKRIRYHRNEQKWQIDDLNLGVKQIYGRSSNQNAVHWVMKGEKRRDVGQNSFDPVRIATAWYLVTTDDRDGNTVNYMYDVINNPVPSDESSLREIYLTSVSDSRQNKLIFNYAQKSSKEYASVSTRYLNGYKLCTLNSQQSVDFDYKVEDGNRLLTEIRQQYITNGSILQFYYKKFSSYYFLRKVISPTVLNFSFHRL